MNLKYILQQEIITPKQKIKPGLKLKWKTQL